jgi:hypothetical protein
MQRGNELERQEKKETQTCEVDKDGGEEREEDE